MLEVWKLYIKEVLDTLTLDNLHSPKVEFHEVFLLNARRRSHLKTERWSALMRVLHTQNV